MIITKATLCRLRLLLEYYERDGVSSKQTGRARQAFMRSARQAGFFAHGEDRLVRPAGPGTKPIEPQKSDAAVAKLEEGGGKGGGGLPPDIDPTIRGLLVRLPKSGDVWPEADRKLWLQLLEGSFQLIYKDKAADQPKPQKRSDTEMQADLERNYEKLT